MWSFADGPLGVLLIHMYKSWRFRTSKKIQLLQLLSSASSFNICKCDFESNLESFFACGRIASRSFIKWRWLEDLFKMVDRGVWRIGPIFECLPICDTTRREKKHSLLIYTSVNSTIWFVLWGLACLGRLVYWCHGWFLEGSTFDQKKKKWKGKKLAEAKTQSQTSFVFAWAVLCIPFLLKSNRWKILPWFLQFKRN